MAELTIPKTMSDHVLRCTRCYSCFRSPASLLSSAHSTCLADDKHEILAPECKLLDDVSHACCSSQQHTSTVREHSKQGLQSVLELEYPSMMYTGKE